MITGLTIRQAAISRIMDDDAHTIRYLSWFSQLPTDTPFGFPHIVDKDSIREETAGFDLAFADGVATLLFLHKPETFEAFLDPKKKRFSFDRQSNPDEFNGFFVGRIGYEVTVGFERRSMIAANSSMSSAGGMSTGTRTSGKRKSNTA